MGVLANNKQELVYQITHAKMHAANHYLQRHTLENYEQYMDLIADLDGLKDVCKSVNSPQAYADFLTYGNDCLYALWFIERVMPGFFSKFSDVVAPPLTIPENKIINFNLNTYKSDTKRLTDLKQLEKNNPGEKNDSGEPVTKKKCIVTLAKFLQQQPDKKLNEPKDDKEEDLLAFFLKEVNPVDVPSSVSFKP